jgi:hypothetical protein
MKISKRDETTSIVVKKVSETMVFRLGKMGTHDQILLTKYLGFDHDKRRESVFLEIRVSNDIEKSESDAPIIHTFPVERFNRTTERHILQKLERHTSSLLAINILRKISI